jgi:hypothetical protein
MLNLLNEVRNKTQFEGPTLIVIALICRAVKFMEMFWIVIALAILCYVAHWLILHRAVSTPRPLPKKPPEFEQATPVGPKLSAVPNKNS